MGNLHYTIPDDLPKKDQLVACIGLNGVAEYQTYTRVELDDNLFVCQMAHGRAITFWHKIRRLNALELGVAT